MMDAIFALIAFVAGVAIGSMFENRSLTDIQIMEANAMCAANGDLKSIEIKSRARAVCVNGAEFLLKEAS